MKIGYTRISKSDGSQNLDLQVDALIKEGVKKGETIVKNVKDCVSKKVPKIFVDNNPNFLNNEKQGAEYAETIVVAMKDVGDKESKVVLKNLKNDCTI